MNIKLHSEHFNIFIASSTKHDANFSAKITNKQKLIDFYFQGCKIKMDDSGNILIKRIAKANVFVKISDGENAVSNEIVKLPTGTLELDKPVKLFDMKKFQQNVAKELKRAYPDRRKLECQVCIFENCYLWNVLINKINHCHEENNHPSLP